ETVAEYRAQVTRIDAAAIGATVASLVPTGGLVVIPGDLPAAWVEGVDALAGKTQGRRVLTLIPDHHICVVFTDQIVNTVPQAFANLNPLRPLTFISG